VLPTKVLVIVEENHTETSALQQMPYLAALADAYGHTTDYQAVAHPSLPNYLALAGGSTFGVTDDNPPSSHPIAGDSVFDTALRAGPNPKNPSRPLRRQAQRLGLLRRPPNPGQLPALRRPCGHNLHRRSAHGRRCWIPARRR